MKNAKIVVDVKKTAEEIKPLHAVGGGPRQGGARLGYDFTKEFSEIGVPYARLHDIEGAYAQNQFVDIHCIFPDFNADVNNPASYNFKPTDGEKTGVMLAVKDYAGELEISVSNGGGKNYRLMESTSPYKEGIKAALGLN